MRFLDTLPFLLLAGEAAALTPSLLPRQSSTKITVNTATKKQIIDGFGISGAFQRANLIVNLNAANQKTLLDLLFNTTIGAGFSIVRNGIGSTPNSNSDYMNTIEPTNPGGPSATPKYVWDGKDSGQLFLSKAAASYGVTTFYGNAWSAPGFMKTNNNDMNGGSLCGVSGATCSSGDWKQAYANYLVQYIKFYAQEGIKVTHLGFLNEPDLSTSYASMQSSGRQSADFIKVLNPTLAAANMSDVIIACCDATGWNVANTMNNDIKSAGADALYGLITSHEYTSRISGSISTSHHVWQTEYADLSGQWNTAWYSGGGSGDGYTWANNIHTALTTGNTNGYLYWEAVQAAQPNVNEKLIKIDGQNITPSARLWAFAQYSRIIRPGAQRVDASGGSLRTTAFVNVDGSIALVILNPGGSAASVSIAGVAATGKTAQGWYTDNSHNMAAATITVAADGSVTGSVGGNSILSILISA